MARKISRFNGQVEAPEEGVLMPLATHYALNRELRERAEKVEGDYKKQLMAILVEEGEDQEGGHKFMPLPESVPLGKKNMTGIKRMRRAGQSLNEDRTEEYLRAQGLYEACTTQVTVINEDAILALNFQGKVTDKDLKALYDEKESFAFYPVYEGE